MILDLLVQAMTRSESRVVHTCAKCKRAYDVEQWAALTSIGTQLIEGGHDSIEDVTLDYRNCIEPGCHGTMVKPV